MGTKDVVVVKRGLPAFAEPSDLEQAKTQLWNLGSTMNEHAYIVGKTLRWVKVKVGHGNFGAWLDDNLWYAETTARKFIRFSRTCDNENSLLEYEKAGKTARHADLAPIDIPADYEDRIQLHHCGIKELYEHVPPDSLDIIITDPPYPKKYISLYGELSEFAAYALRPGASCMALCGHSYLPDVLNRVTSKLRYHWIIDYSLPGSATQIFPRKVIVCWKPLLWLVKGEYVGDWHADKIKSDATDKRFHGWGQSESGTGRIIDAFSAPDDLICDPFLGGGTTALMSLALGRKFIGCDIDAQAIETTKERIQNEYERSEA